jgi:hypothetical protein
VTPGTSAAGSTPYRPQRDVLVLVCLLFLAWVGPVVAARLARPAFLNFGPNDVDYVRGFRPDWERDGKTIYHWTGTRAEVSLPIGLRGDGVLRLRARRHFIEPAHVTLTISGRRAAVFDVQRDVAAYRTIEVPLSGLAGDVPLEIGIDAPSENPRPLGIAMDWVEIERAPGASFVLPASLRWGVIALAVLAFLASRLAGLSLGLAAPQAALLSVAATLGIAWDPLAAERILALGLPLAAASSVVAVALVRWRPSAGWLGVESSSQAGALMVVILFALAIRMTLVLHPQFFYPDVRVHGLFAWELARSGLGDFLRNFTANQYRYSLGLQFENGHWYAFPYPPAFYILCWPLIRTLGYRPEVAVSLLPAAINGLEALLVFGIARRLGEPARVAVTAAALLPLLPVFLARFALALFPALLGQAVDALVILYLLKNAAELHRPRIVLTLGALIAAALLTYTQSLLTFGILVPLFLITQLAFDRAAGAWRRHVGLAVAGALGAVLSLALFYGQYIPVFRDLRRGVPMAEEQVLLSRSAPSDAGAAIEEEPNDPYAGPDTNLWRGLKKAGSRLRIFYGVFAPFVVLGVALVAWRAEGARSRLVVVWAAMFLLFNLASGGLPGPNLVRFNKDIEVVAPLCCIGLATLGVMLWERGRAWRLVAAVLAVSFGAFGVGRAVRYLTERFVLER